MSWCVSGFESASTEAEYFFFSACECSFSLTKNRVLWMESWPLCPVCYKLWPLHFPFHQPPSGFLPPWSPIAETVTSSLGTYSRRHAGALNQVSAGFQSDCRSVIHRDILPLSPVLHLPITRVHFVSKHFPVILSPWRPFPGSLRVSTFLGHLCIGL